MTWRGGLRQAREGFSGFRMDVALVFNKETGFSRQMTATEFESRFRGNENLGIVPTHPGGDEGLEIISPDDAIPLTLRRSHTRLGNTEVVKACWVRPPGFGDHDHVFNHHAQQGLGEALKQGKSVLLSLNLDLASRPISFRNLKEKGAQNLENWIASKRGHYISIPVHSAEEARETLLKIRELDADFSFRDRVFALHREAVVPYRNFFLAHRPEDMAHLYNALQERRAGVPVGETRMIGFPRLFRLVPTETAIQEHFGRGIKGNRINMGEGKPLFSTLIFSKHDEALRSDPYKILTDELLAHRKQGVYVLASPSVTVGESPDDWKMMRWMINDISRQTTPSEAAESAPAPSGGNTQDGPAQHQLGI